MKSGLSQSADFDLAVNMARQSLYRFAALSLLDPQAGSWETLSRLRDDRTVSEAATLVRHLPQACAGPLGPGERAIADLDPRPVLDRLPDSRQALNAAYERTFGLLVSAACPPYETEYISGKFVFQRSNTLADVSGFYQAFGLTVAHEHPERHDHVVLELEFMAFLLGLERQAAEGNSKRRHERLAVCRDAQSRFVNEHLAWWVPAFAKLLGKEDPGRFYAAAGVFLAALIPAERALLGIPLASHCVGPSMVEQPESCEGCHVAG